MFYIVELHFKIYESLAAKIKKFRTKYGKNIDFTSSSFKRVIEKCWQTESVSDAKHTGRPKTNRLNVNIEAMPESAGESSGTLNLRIKS